MLYRIMRELGSMHSARRRAAILMARGLPWEDLEQFLALFDRAQEDARRSARILAAILMIVGAGTVGVYSVELRAHHLLAPAIMIAAAFPVAGMFYYFRSKARVENGLRTILGEIDDPSFVAVALGVLSEKHADRFSFRPDLLKAIARLLPEITIERCTDWTPEERNALSHGLSTVLPTSAGGRDALSHSPNDYALYILKVLQRMGDGRETELVRLVSTIDPVTEQHQKVREASLKCLKSIEKRLGQNPCNDVSASVVQESAPVRGPLAGIETDITYLLKPALRSTSARPDHS